jgi:SAM-dependent methyltransferase
MTTKSERGMITKKREKEDKLKGQRRRTAVINQCQKPMGWLGRFVLWSMNARHSKVTDWGLEHISVGKHDTILDIGCGGGRTVGKLATMASEGKVYGVDYSEESVAASKRTNAQEIDAGRVEIRQGSVSQLPFGEGMFDLVSGVETHFWWPDLRGDVREVFRVLKPGGTLVLIAEVYGKSMAKAGQLAEKYAAPTGMKLLSVEEHRELLEGAGFSDVRIIEERGKGWICAIGRKT